MNNLEIAVFLAAGYAFMIFTHLRLDALAMENERLIKRDKEWEDNLYKSNTNLQD